MAGISLLIGNSDGIGLATTRLLLDRGWRATGISRSESPVEHPSYRHLVCDVGSAEYPDRLRNVVAEVGTPDLCIYFAGVGELLDVTDMGPEKEIFEVNLMGLIKTLAEVVPAMVKRGEGHFIGLSSVADDLVSWEAPSYHASKAAFTSYLAGLALALRPRGVAVSNVRFGFVDTKMAKGDVRPFMMSTERAARHILTCMEKKPVRYTAPWTIIPLLKFRALMLRLGLLRP
jgi:short-subunit dehydrogenase